MRLLGVVASSYLQSTTAFNSIATNTVGSSGASSITFSSIPSTYKHLQLRYYSYADSNVDVMMSVNSTNGLKDHYIQGYGTGINSNWDNPGSDGLYISTFGFGTSYPTVGIIDFLDYTNTNKYKTVKTLSGRDQNGSGRIMYISMLFDTLSAISTITLTPSSSKISANSQFALYGIK